MQKQRTGLEGDQGAATAKLKGNAEAGDAAARAREFLGQVDDSAAKADRRAAELAREEEQRQERERELRRREREARSYCSC